MTGFNLFSPMRSTLKNASSRLVAAFVLVIALTLANTVAFAQFHGSTPLTLVHGWVPYGNGTSLPMISEENGLVHLQGAIASGTSAVAFQLPSGFHPATAVYVPVDMCNATNGRLNIQTNGLVSVEAESSFANAQCFTSLDGVVFAPSSSNFTPLTLINGWTNGPFTTANAAYRVIGNIVHFQGAIATSGTNLDPFVMPAGTLPATDVYIPVDLCNGTNGRLHITPSGAVDVEPEGGTTSNAQCFTSLEGAWYSPVIGASNPLAPLNGWANAPFATSNSAAINEYGFVFLKGAISSGSTTQAFTVPEKFRPLSTVYVKVDLCNAANGRLIIESNGAVSVQAENAFSDAQCFTSLDGVSFKQ